MIKKSVIIAITLGILFMAAEEAAADQPYEVYMRIEGMKGMVKIDVDATNWMQVSGMPDPKNVLFGQTAPADSSGERTIPADFSVVKPMDDASPLLANMGVGGQYIKEVRLDFYKAGENKKPFFTVKLTGVKILKIDPVKTKKSQRQMESVRLQYTKIDWGLPSGKEGRRKKKQAHLPGL